MYISPPKISPLGRVLGAVFGLLVLAGFLVFGFFVLLAALALGLLAWAWLAVRALWLRRKQPAPGPDRPVAESEIIEAEYTVISRRRD